MELFVAGLSHRTAPVAVREKLAVVPTELEARLRKVAGLPGVREAVVVSTCNRVELYGTFSDPDQALTAVHDFLIQELTGGDPDHELLPRLPKHLYQRTRGEAVHHLFRVAASLDSLVVGEPQILGQVKDAFDLAVKSGTAGPLLGEVFSRAFRVARRVRRDTGIAQQRVSVSTVAVDLARQVWGGFEGRQVLVMGAGKMADLAVRVLKREGAEFVVTNRTRARAEELAGRLGGRVVAWEALPQALRSADIVLTSTAAREPIITRATMGEVLKGRRGRPLVFIDIAVPRNVESSVGKLHDVFLYDIDDLQKIVSRNLDDRKQEASRAEALIEEEVGRFLAVDRGRSAGPTISAMRTRVGSVVRAELDKIRGAFPPGEATDRAFRGLADRITAKLMHTPSVALKKAGPDDEGLGLLEAAHRLFDLSPLKAVGPESDALLAEEGGEGAETTGEHGDASDPTTMKGTLKGVP